MKKIKDDSELFGCGGSILAVVIGSIVTFIGLAQFNYATHHKLALSLLGGTVFMLLFFFCLLFYNWMVERICKKQGHKGCVCQRCGEEEHDRDGCICRRCDKTYSVLDEYHDWDGCKCKRCGKSGNHDWGDGCVCKRCEEANQYRPEETHEWDGCKCRRCGKERDIEHDWDGCTCRKCGETKPNLPDEYHDWDGCKCKRCGKSGNHDWDGCKCTRCGAERDEGHDWDGCICRKCGKERDIEHDWDGCECLRCEATRHVWVHTGTRVKIEGEERISDNVIPVSIEYDDYRCERCGKEKEKRV